MRFHFGKIHNRRDLHGTYVTGKVLQEKEETIPGVCRS